MTWGLQTKVLDDLQLAQRRITSAGFCLGQLTEEYGLEGNQSAAREHALLWVSLTVTMMALGQAARSTTLLLTLRLPASTLDQLRTLWGQLADLLAGDITASSMPRIDDQVDRIRALVCESALAKQAHRQAEIYAQQTKEMAKRCRN